MNKFKIAVLFILFNTSVQSQPFLLCQGSERLHIYNVSNNKWYLISPDAFGKLVGYELQSDSIECFFEMRGKLSSSTFYYSLFNATPEYPVSFTPPYEVNHIATDNFYFGKYRLVSMYNGGNLRMYNGDEMIWDLSKHYGPLKEDTSRTHFLSGYAHPQLSPDGKKIMVEKMSTRMFSWNKSTIAELDFFTGLETEIVEGKGASYSPDGNFILYHDNKYNFPYIYDLTKRKRIDFNSEVAFWLYK